MYGDEIKTLFEEIIDDSITDESFFILLENADQELRDERDWYFLREKGSITRSVSDGYTTSHNLPANFDRIRTDHDAIRSDGRIYYPIDPDKQEEFKYSDGYYYIKYNVESEVWQIFFTGTGVSETVYVFYQKRGTEITESNSATQNAVWPGKRGAYLAWLMASRVSGGIDGDEINFRMSPEQKQTAMEMKTQLISWDTKMKLRAMGGRTRMRTEQRPLGQNQINTRHPYNQ